MQDSESKLRVLVVDDEYIIASTWSQILRMSGFETDLATSGEEAIRKAIQRRPDLLLSDVLMRGISGIETAAEILKFHPQCRVILISGHAETAHSMAEDYPGKPDFEILRKPMHPLILLDRIREKMRSALGPSSHPPHPQMKCDHFAFRPTGRESLRQVSEDISGLHLPVSR